MRMSDQSYPASLETASIEELRERLREAEDTLDAIRSGAVDAVVVGSDDDRRIYTLESADRPYRVLVEQMQEGAVMLSADGTILYANERAGQLLGAQVEHVVGSAFSAFVLDGQHARLQELIRESATGTARDELTVLSANETPVSCSFKAFEAGRDQDRLICGVISDLSQQRQMEARLHQAQKMEAVGQLTGGLAHDFNNLLQAIHGNLELVKRSPADPERVLRWTGNAMRAVSRGAKLTAQLLAFSRSQKLELKPVGLAALVHGMADLFDRTLGAGIDLRLELGDDNALVVADPTQLELALLNLAINARDAMPTGGVLRISTLAWTVTDDPDLADGDYVELSVADTGTGMPADVAARAFEPFLPPRNSAREPVSASPRCTESASRPAAMHRSRAARAARGFLCFCGVRPRQPMHRTRRGRLSSMRATGVRRASWSSTMILMFVRSWSKRWSRWGIAWTRQQVGARRST